MRRFVSGRVAEILRRIEAMSDDELAEEILRTERGEWGAFDPQTLTDAEVRCLVAELEA
jgi:hypothetical protein